MVECDDACALRRNIGLQAVGYYIQRTKYVFVCMCVMHVHMYVCMNVCMYRLMRVFQSHLVNTLMSVEIVPTP